MFEKLTSTALIDRFGTLPPRSPPPSRPAPAVPTSEFPSRTPARPPRPSTAGSCSVLSLSLRTSRRRRRPSPCADTLALLAELRKVRTTQRMRFYPWCYNANGLDFEGNGKGCSRWRQELGTNMSDGEILVEALIKGGLRRPPRFF